MAVEGRIHRRIQSLNKPRSVPVDKSTTSLRVRKHQGWVGEHATLGEIGPGIHTVVKEITKDVDIIKEIGYPDFPLRQLEDAIPKDVPMMPIAPIWAKNPLALPNLLMLAGGHVGNTFSEPIETAQSTLAANQPEELDHSSSSFDSETSSESSGSHESNSEEGEIEREHEDG